MFPIIRIIGLVFIVVMGFVLIGCVDPNDPDIKDPGIKDDGCGDCGVCDECFVPGTEELVITNFSADKTNVIYNGQGQVVTVSFTGEGISAETAGAIIVSYSGKDETVYAESTIAPRNAGLYDIKIETKGGSVYAPFAKTALGTLLISPKPILITPDSGKIKFFDTSDPVFTYTSSEALYEGDNFSGALSRVPGEGVATYAITIGSLSAGSNYILSLSEIVLFEIVWEIHDLHELEISDFNVIENEKTYNGASVSVTVEYSEGIDNTAAGNITVYYSGAEGTVYPESTTAPVNAGTYNILVQTTGGTGFAAFAKTAIDTLIINPKSITITPDSGQGKQKGTEEPELIFTPGEPLYTGDEFTGKLSREAGEDEGDYLITIGTLSAGANYSLDFIETAMFNIFNLPELELSDFTISANVRTYNGVRQGVTVEYASNEITVITSGVIIVYYEGIGETVYAESTNAPNNAGTYSLAIRTTGGTNSWMPKTTTSDILTINPKPITITPNVGQSKPLGSANPILTFTSDEALYSADVFTGSLAREVGESIGIYEIYIGSLSAGSNYQLSLSSSAVIFEITKAQGPGVSAPLLDTATSSSITIFAVETPAGHTIEYAINTVNSAPADGWQTELLFDNLIQNTSYFVFARTTETETYLPGPAAMASFNTTDIEPQDQSFNITFEQITNSAPDIINSNVTLYRVTNGGPTSATLSFNGDVDAGSIRWRVNNTDVIATTPAFTISAANTAYNTVSEHFVTLSVRIDGVPYSRVISFNVAY